MYFWYTHSIWRHSSLGEKTEINYFEYNAWLQERRATPVRPVRMVAAQDIGDMARDECGKGMVRLYGPGVWQDSAESSVTLMLDGGLPAEAYRLKGGRDGVTVAGGGLSGLLYGVYALLLHLGAGGEWETLAEESAPAAPHRALNHWDDMDGDVERGYAGKSLFFRDNNFSYDPGRMRDYARLLASVGINELAFNNVNVTPESARLMTAELLPGVARLADIFRPFGIRLLLAVHFESPVILGGLPTSDPLDARGAEWWRNQADEIYRHVPDLAGFLVKADSEFRAGPAAHGRTQADGANMLARALTPHGGVIYWRCFVYNCQQDWRDIGIDRMKAAYECFQPLDGDFDDNVILQVKLGPSDFQVREPVSPLLGAMKKTRLALEFQITQEYTGQQIDLYSMAVQWEEVLSQHVNEAYRLREIVGRGIDTVCAVANVGSDRNWTGHTLAQANLFAFGRMAWDPGLTAGQVTREWARLTFGPDPAVLEGVTQMILASRSVYEKYNAPLGIGWMVNPGRHYGPSVDGYEYSKWGTYHRADNRAIGVDRTSCGTGYTAQYDPWLAGIYDDLASCPEELLLFFHRLPYDYRLKNGKTLMQHIYDTHFEGVEEVEGFIRLWESLKDRLPEETYLSVRGRLEYQLANAREWRDVINTYFFRKTGIPDEKGRTIFA
jgi:alpha-glucuronidase